MEGTLLGTKDNKIQHDSEGRCGPEDGSGFCGDEGVDGDCSGVISDFGRDGSGICGADGIGSISDDGAVGLKVVMLVVVVDVIVVVKVMVL